MFGVPFSSRVACDVLILLQAWQMKKGLNMTWTRVGVVPFVFRVVSRDRVTGGTSWTVKASSGYVSSLVMVDGLHCVGRSVVVSYLICIMALSALRWDL